MWSDDTNNLASTLLACFGGVRMLHIGSPRETLRRELLRQGMDIVCAQEFSSALKLVAGRCVLVSDVLDNVSPRQHAQCAADLLAAGARAVMVLAKHDHDQTREQIEQAWLEVGWRRHPRLNRMVSYEGLEAESHVGMVALLLEPVPAEAATQYPLATLAASRGLHMDMLREASRRADAHLARYTLASELIRRGDRVLDTACGLGYGAHVLRTTSEAASVLGVDASEFAVRYARAHYADRDVDFREGDVCDLRDVPDASVNVVVCMETLEHVEDPARALREFARVLTPGGRVIVSVPNQWGDTTGPHRNPHHLHEYTWASLRAQLEAFFLPEQRWRQTAGGGRKLPQASRQLARVPWELEVSEADPDRQAEWWLACAMKTPIGAGKAGYQETMFRDAPVDPAFHVVAFARDYDNPWLVRAMVSTGARLSHPRGLMELATRVRETARAGSPDQGAAICVLAYQALGRDAHDEPMVRELLGWIDQYEHDADGSPHAWRWQISNRFVAGRLWLALGDRAQARAQFAACAGMDVLSFSPLLATKTIESCLIAGLMDLCDGRTQEARRWWMRGLEESRRVISGSWLNVWGTPEHPMSFGLREVTEVMDAAARCAGWLAHSEDQWVRPGLAWTGATALSIADQRRWAEQLNVARVWLEEQRAHWTALALARGREMETLREALAQAKTSSSRLHQREQELEIARAWHERQSSLRQQERDAALAESLELRGWNRTLDEAVAFHTAQSTHWQKESTVLREHLAQARAWIASLQESQRWHQQQASQWQHIGDEHHTRVKSLEVQLQEHAHELTSLRGWLATLEEAKAWHEAQAKAFEGQTHVHMHELKEVGKQLEDARAQYRAQQAEQDARSAEHTALRAQHAALRAEHEHLIAALEARLAKKDRAIDAMILRIEQMRTFRGLAKTVRGVLFGGQRGPDPQDFGADSESSR
jgi:ubiquinone/menaquinone biosynthesis C-methylase UbiE